MSQSSEALCPGHSTLRNKIIVALDVESAGEARAIVSELRGHVGAFKIGLQLFTSAGPQLVKELAADNKIFLDLKFHDIPNTVAKASAASARLGVWMFNMHTLGGREMMETAVAEVRRVRAAEHLERPLIIGVTILTSSNVNTTEEVGLIGDPGSHVVSLAKLAADAGLDGVVASPLEVAAIKQEVGAKLLTITPGIRPNLATTDDQKRVTSVGRAVANGSDYVVIGRPILSAENRIEAVARIVSESEG